MAKHRIDESTPETLAEIASALSEPHRLRLLGMLHAGELCLCDLTGGLDLAPSTVSNHMAILKRAGLVETRKDGRWMHFRLSETDPACPQAQALAWALAHLPESTKSRPSCLPEGACCP
jgi:DNA-binding transcriptional ArsR family regulator